ncbi:hypothetical protein V2A60_004873 [Cordyceps javanica]
MPSAPGPRFDSRATSTSTSTSASRTDASERGPRRSSRRARSSAAGLSEASQHRAVNEVVDAAGSSETVTLVVGVAVRETMNTDKEPRDAGWHEPTK